MGIGPGIRTGSRLFGPHRPNGPKTGGGLGDSGAEEEGRRRWYPQRLAIRDGWRPWTQSPAGPDLDARPSFPAIQHRRANAECSARKGCNPNPSLVLGRV